MKADLQSIILDALYDHRESSPGFPQMTFNELYAAIGVSPSDKKKVGEVRHQLFALKRNGWVDSESLKDGSGGMAEITPLGATLVEDSRKSAASTSELPPPKPSGERRTTQKSVGLTDALELCPPTLEDLVRGQACARLVRRDDLNIEIKKQFTRALGGHHIIVLYGQPLVGKTKMLVRLSEALVDEFVPLMVTVQGSALHSLDAFAFDLAAQLTDKFYKSCPVSLILADPVPEDFEPGMGRRAFRVHWKNLMRNAGKRKPLVMFDEVERLLDDPEKLDSQILTFLDDFIRNPENGFFIMAGSERIRHANSEQFSLLIAKGQPIQVRYYDRETVAAVFSAMQRYLTFDRRFLQCLTSFCDGHPRLLPSVYQAIRSLGKQKLETSDIEPVLAEVIKQTDNFLWAMWIRLSSDERDVITLISQNEPALFGELEYSVRELAKLARQPAARTRINYRSVTRGVTGLEEREWIEWRDRKRGLFHFKLGIFPLWAHRQCVPIPGRPANIAVRGILPFGVPHPESTLMG